MYLRKILGGLCSAAPSPVEEQGLAVATGGDTGQAVTACGARGDVQSGVSWWRRQGPT